MSGSIGLAIFFAADIAIAVVILAMLGKLPVRRVVEWARNHKLI